MFTAIRSLTQQWRDIAVVAEAACRPRVARLAIPAFPFRKIAPWLGRHAVETKLQSISSKVESPHRVTCAVDAAERRVPWKTECLVRAIAAQSMPQRRRASGMIFLGLTQDDHDERKAHPWLRCRDETVAGRSGQDAFTIVSTFSFGSSSHGRHNISE